MGETRVLDFWWGTQKWREGEGVSKRGGGGKLGLNYGTDVNRSK